MNNIPRKTGSETKNQYFENLRKNKFFPPNNPQNISFKTVTLALEFFDLADKDKIDVVMSLLDNTLYSLFASADDKSFADGASIADIGCYVGIWMRDGNKLDREGRDYWMKPLVECGITEELEWNSSHKKFFSGHLTPKSPNGCYKLNDEFVRILKQKEKTMLKELKIFCSSSEIAKRREKQAEAIKISKSLLGSNHQKLIQAAIKIYSKDFLPEFEVVFIDDSDGNRITNDQRKKFEEIGLEITLADSWPDIVLYNKTNNSLWFIEAVTSDGEFDNYRLNRAKELCDSHNKNYAGATTVYRTWSETAKRQNKEKNLALDTYLWIEHDPTKVFQVKDCHN